MQVHAFLFALVITDFIVILLYIRKQYPQVLVVKENVYSSDRAIVYSTLIQPG